MYHVLVGYNFDVSQPKCHDPIGAFFVIFCKNKWQVPNTSAIIYISHLQVCADRNLVVGKVIVLLHAREEIELPKKSKRW